MDLAPGDTHVATERWNSEQRSQIWLVDLERDVTSLLAGQTGHNFGSPVWSPDSLRVGFVEGRGGKVWAKPAGGGEETLLFQLDDGRFTWLEDWSNTGDLLAILFVGEEFEGAVVPVTGDQTPVIFDAAANLDEMHFSPDGNWIAYNANHTGRMEVYVVPYPPTGERIQVSSQGGVQAHWRSDGHELFYLTPQGVIMAVEVETGNGFRPGIPEPLFQTSIVVNRAIDQYAVASDGQRFLIVNPSTSTEEYEITVVTNWTAELDK